VINYNLFLDKAHKQGLSLRTILYDTVLYIEFSLQGLESF